MGREKRVSSKVGRRDRRIEEKGEKDRRPTRGFSKIPFFFQNSLP